MIDAFLDATDQAALIRAGDVSPLELVNQAIRRIESLNPQINAVTVKRFEKARLEAERAPDGPFRGVPYVIKDHVLVTKGDLHTQGVKALKDAGLVGTHDSYFVDRMRTAGFILVGKTNLPELALAPTTEPVAWGPARNPWDGSRSTGGSSGGSAAAVASGMVPIAEGTDGGGSIRMPASHCGVIGLKTTRGRISAGPGVFASDSVSGMGTEGLIGRSVRDVAAVLDIVSGHRPGDSFSAPAPARPFGAEVGSDPGRLRIGVLTEDATGVAEVDPECVTAARATAATLAQLGHDVSDAFPARLKQGAWPEQFLPCMPTLLKREIERLGALIGRPLTSDDVEPSTWALVEMASGLNTTAAQYAAGVDSLRIYAAEIETWWEDEGWDVLLTPTLPSPAPRLGSFGQSEKAFVENVTVLTPEIFTVPFNVSGQPAVSLPLHQSADGLPIGVQLVAGFGREDLLIRLSSQLEVESPWANRQPTMDDSRSVGDRATSPASTKG